MNIKHISFFAKHSLTIVSFREIFRTKYCDIREDVNIFKIQNQTYCMHHFFSHYSCHKETPCNERCALLTPLLPNLILFGIMVILSSQTRVSRSALLLEMLSDIIVKTTMQEFISIISTACSRLSFCYLFIFCRLNKNDRLRI